MRAAGVDVQLFADSLLCCASADTYSLMQSVLSYQLRDKKLANLEAGQLEMIVSANIVCVTHLQSGASMPVKH